MFQYFISFQTSVDYQNQLKYKHCNWLQVYCGVGFLPMKKYSKHNRHLRTFNFVLKKVVLCEVNAEWLLKSWDSDSNH